MLTLSHARNVLAKFLCSISTGITCSLARSITTNKVMYSPWILAFRAMSIWYGMCLLCVIGLAVTCRMVSMVSCNLVTTLTLGPAPRLANSDVIMLERTSHSHLQSYLFPAKFILNFYVSCGCWLTCRRSSTSISLGTKRTSGMSDSNGVGLTHSPTIGM